MLQITCITSNYSPALISEQETRNYPQKLFDDYYFILIKEEKKKKEKETPQTHRTSMGLTAVTQGEGWGRTLAVGQGCSTAHAVGDVGLFLLSSSDAHCSPPIALSLPSTGMLKDGGVETHGVSWMEELITLVMSSVCSALGREGGREKGRRKGRKG